MLRLVPPILFASLLAVPLALTGCNSMYRDMYSPTRSRFVPPPPPKPKDIPAEQMPPPVEAPAMLPEAPPAPPPAEAPATAPVPGMLPS